MPLPSFHITISGSLLAAYAAVLSTITGLVQFWTFRRDRARVDISVRHNIEIVGDPRYSGKNLTLVTVSNLGRRPVTIVSVGAYRAYPLTAFILTDINPPIPHELTEGKSLVAILPSKDIDLSKVIWWQASDAVGREYRLDMIGWLARHKFRKDWREDSRRTHDDVHTREGNVEQSEAPKPQVTIPAARETRWTESRKLVRKYEGVLVFLGATVALAAFIVHDGFLDRAKETRDTQTAAKMLLVQSTEFVDTAGQGAVISAETIDAQHLPTLETQFKLLPIKRQQISGIMFLLIGMHDRTGDLRTAEGERKQLEQVRNRGKDLIRLYKAILDTADGRLNELPKDEKQLAAVSSAMGNFETAWTSFSSDSKQVTRTVANKASDEERSAESDLERWTRINYFLYVVAWILGLAGKFAGVKASDEEG
jgi:hypothetical protein